MKKSTVKLLEERVEQAVRRVRELSGERDALIGELEGLRQQLDELAGSASGHGPESRGEAAEAWQARRQEAVELIQHTLAELGAN